MKPLTLEMLKVMEPHFMFANGSTLIVHPWFNDAPQNLVNELGEPDIKGKHVKVNWVAVRGGIHDWAIYHSLSACMEQSDCLGGFAHLERSYEDVAKWGAKLRDKEKIKQLTGADESAMEWYRQ